MTALIRLSRARLGLRDSGRAQAIKSLDPADASDHQVPCALPSTGTPIENDLSNLWSLFDFLDKGLPAPPPVSRLLPPLEDHPEGRQLKAMISPFLLRRVKTDKKIISDLPDKQEQVDYIELSKKQAVLCRSCLAASRRRALWMSSSPTAWRACSPTRTGRAIGSSKARRWTISSGLYELTRFPSHRQGCFDN